MSDLPPPPSGAQPPPEGASWNQGNPPPPGQWQPQPPQKQKGRGLRGVLIGVGACLVIAVIAVIVSVFVVGSAVEEAVEEADLETTEDGVSTGLGSADATGDVELLGCGPDEDGLGWGTAQVQITNNSSERSNYAITVAFEVEDGATRLDTGLAFAEAIEPGQSTEVEAATTSEVPDDVECKFTQVERTASA